MSRILRMSAVVVSTMLLACSSNDPLPPDATPPGRVTDLHVKSVRTNVVTLRWKTPGDNGFSGTASAYQVRWSPNIITEGNFAGATLVPDPPVPAAAGTPEQFDVPNMDITEVLHFALRTFDEVGLVSEVSNDAVWTPGTLPVQYYKVLSAVRDNTIYSEDGNASNGSGQYIFAGIDSVTTQGFARRGLLAFPIPDSIPAGARIDSVWLTLHLSATPAGPGVVALHALRADWGEGASNAPGNEASGTAAQTNDATWTYRHFNIDTWATAGGDYDSTASAQNGFTTSGYHTWRSTQMNTDVQHWLDAPDSNFGWVVLGSESGTRTLKRFDSRENPSAAYRPRLKVYYTVLP